MVKQLKRSMSSKNKVNLYRSNGLHAKKLLLQKTPSPGEDTGEGDNHPRHS